MLNVTPRAKAAIESLGGSTSGQDIKWPQGTKLVDSKDRGGWGNLSIRVWRLPNGQKIVWDSDDRQYQIGRSTK